MIRKLSIGEFLFFFIECWFLANFNKFLVFLNLSMGFFVFGTLRKDILVISHKFWSDAENRIECRFSSPPKFDTALSSLSSPSSSLVWNSRRCVEITLSMQNSGTILFPLFISWGIWKPILTARSRRRALSAKRTSQLSFEGITFYSFFSPGDSALRLRVLMLNQINHWGDWTLLLDELALF